MRILVAVLFLFSIQPLFSADLTLETLLGSPFPSEGVASSTNDQAAWVLNNRGHYNVWIARGPDYKLKQITKYSRDDGQEISGLCITGSGDRIVYVRGGEENAAGEIPNPASDPKGVKRQIWSVAVDAGEPLLIAEGSQPDVSPDGKTVVYVRSKQIYSAGIDGTVKESPLVSARGSNATPKWSPDGAHILFTSYRSDHNFVGIYGLQSGEIVWLAPSVDRDFSPIWSPDGKRVAFLRFPGAQGEPRKDNEPSDVFSIWVADAASGEAKQVWKSSDKTGGFAQFYPSNPLMWAQNDRLLFYWEKDNWMRIYSVSATGGEAIALTPASCETETATLNSDRTHLIFSSNCNDIERRHLWKVPVQGGKATPLTNGKGIETYPLQPSKSNHVFFLSATAKQPASPAKVSIGGGEIELLAPELLRDFPMQKLVEPEIVLFRAADGLEIHGQLFKPAGARKDAKLPALVYMHGGPIRQMLPGWHYYGYYHNAYAMNQFLASNGYVVLSVNFRSGIGYGRAFRRAPGQGPAGATEYQDILAAAHYLQTLPEVDDSKVGLFGGSYGGYLTAMGLSRDSKLFAAGVDIHGVHDWSLRAKLRGAEDWGIVGEDLMKLAYQSSPVSSVSSWSSPVLFIIGDDDRNVDFIETTDLVQRLREQNRAHVEMLILPDEVHSFLRYQSWVKVYKATFDFFNRFLK